MEILLIVLSIVSAIMVWRLIGFGVRSANQINRSTAATAAALQYITDAMPAEATKTWIKNLAHQARIRALKMALIGATIIVLAEGSSIAATITVHAPDVEGRVFVDVVGKINDGDFETLARCERQDQR